MPEQPIEPYSQLRRALAYIHAHESEHGGWGCDTVEVDTEELEALLAERTRLRERIHQVVDEGNRRCAATQGLLDYYRGLHNWAMDVVRSWNGGKRIYASTLDLAAIGALYEELTRAYEIIRLCGGYLSKIGGPE